MTRREGHGIRPGGAEPKTNVEGEGNPRQGVEAREARAILSRGIDTSVGDFEPGRPRAGFLRRDLVAPLGRNRRRVICRRSGDLAIGKNGVLDPRSQTIDQLGVALDVLPLAPTRHVGDGVGGGV